MIEKLIAYTKNKVRNYDTAHDWDHIDRVRNLAVFIAKKENADVTLCEIAAILHDIADHKFNKDISAIIQDLKGFFKDYDYPEEKQKIIFDVILDSSFSKKSNSDNYDIVFKIIQDADRLDAIGAIGIARTFSYGGANNFAMANKESINNEKHNDTTLSHFHQKLNLLFDSLHTTTAKSIGKSRHDFLLTFQKQFISEWNGDDFMNL